MSDFISNLASQAGINSGMAEHGTGALLASLKGNVSADVFSSMLGGIPNASSLMNGFETLKKKSPASSDSPLMNVAGSLLGGQSKAAASLLSNFSTAGFSVDNLKTFLPVIMGLLKSQLSDDVMKQVESNVPGLSVLAGSDAGAGLLSKIKSLF